MNNYRKLCAWIVVISAITMISILALLAYFNDWTDAQPSFMDEDEETSDKSSTTEPEETSDKSPTA